MSTESHSPYSKLPEKHETVQHFKPQFIARGGDHLVYEIPGHPESVVKASTFKLMDVLEQNENKGVPLDTFPETMIDWSGNEYSPAEDVRIRNEQISALRSHFGKAHTLPERRFFMKVPVTPELLAGIYEEDIYRHRSVPPGAETLEEVWSTVVVQGRAEILARNDADTASLNFGSFVEERKGEKSLDSESLSELNKALIFNAPGEDSTQREKLFLEIQDGTPDHRLSEILEKAKGDAELHETLEKFVKASITYAEETGNILALAGQDNVLFYKDDGKWTYLLVDVLPVHAEAMYALSKEVLHAAATGRPVWQHKSDVETTYEKQLLMKTLNFVRMINGLAMELGIPNRLNLVSEEDRNNVNLEEILA